MMIIFVNEDHLLPSQPIYFFFPFSFLTALASSWSKMLNSRGKRGHPYVVLDLSGKASSLSLLGMSFAKGFCRGFGLGCL